ncbi:hypothetical protein LBK6_05485 [Leptospira borgpetersenii serovar Hardjo]|nr:hypothetical protein LBK6_05485 [Leptospira borgpetersenii serovar Hardjo]AWV69692.1 hypothetical protein B9T54_05980 [Leptospira borgpetersenii serovar Hardjo-bovis]AMX61054.1 hypothetical protein LBK9_05420 [Leptospira borgpetersenii serovar Hardjo]AMX64297.1 hypothetical protein LBK30_05450 [Leptospira borgpetersenii serovar Hardjo]AMX67538.1 hypothetical protein LBHA_05435 [Leptospira borgpetersenii serovar Hardjo]
MGQGIFSEEKSRNNSFRLSSDCITKFSDGEKISRGSKNSILFEVLDIVFAPDVFEAKILLEVPSPIFYPVLISVFLIFGSFHFVSLRIVGK